MLTMWNWFLQAVQQIVTNLMISVIEIRSEESFDVQPYTNNRRHEKIVVPLEGDIEQLRCEYLTVCTYTYVRVRMFHCCLCLHWE